MHHLIHTLVYSLQTSRLETFIVSFVRHFKQFGRKIGYMAPESGERYFRNLFIHDGAKISEYSAD